MLGAREGVRRLGAREGVRRRGVREGVRRRGVREGALQPLGEWRHAEKPAGRFGGDCGELAGRLEARSGGLCEGEHTVCLGSDLCRGGPRGARPSPREIGQRLVPTTSGRD